MEFSITTRDETNSLIWTHGIFAPKVSKEFVDELNKILSSIGFDNRNRVSDVSDSATEIQDDIPKSC